MIELPMQVLSVNVNVNVDGTGKRQLKPPAKRQVRLDP